MLRMRDGETLAQKAFMCSVKLQQTVRDGGQKMGQSESETIRKALRDGLANG